MALEATALLGTRGVARVDLILDEHEGPMILEIDTIPGLTETSLLPLAADTAGIDFDALVGRMLAGAERGAPAPG